MRSLVIGHVMPWPAMSGSSIRLATTVDALAVLGDVDLCCLLEPAGAASAAPPPDAPVDRCLVLTRPPVATRLVSRLRAFVSPLPDRFGRRDYGTVRAELGAFVRLATEPYDLVWLFRAESFVAFAGTVSAPVVTDLDDLEDRKLAAELVVRSAPSAIAARIRHSVRGVRDRLELVRWRALHRRVARLSAATVVCSEVDRARLGGAAADVVTNCYPRPAVARGRQAVSDPPTVSIVGLLTYAPNVDAATFAAQEVLPLLRQRVPGARLRLVGRADARVERLAQLPGVEVTGWVADVEEELSRADAALVPIRYGSGTRVKVLEAFAHRIPVVSTAIGAEGLGARHDVELLLADSPDELAQACANVLRDQPLRSRLVDAGHRLWEQTGTPARAADEVQAVARRAVDTTRKRS